MDQVLIDRYVSGDIYQKLLTRYGKASADAIAAAAKTGDEQNVQDALIRARNNGQLFADDSTGDAFIDQITTDPLAAPLQSLNNLTGATVKAFFSQPWVVGLFVVVVAVGVFAALGGFAWAGKKVFK